MKTLGIIFGNLHDKDVGELTAVRSLGSVPFGGRFRLIDFVLSNMVNSGITKVGIITKNNYQSLMDHVGNGKHWDLSRKNGGLIMLPPFSDSGFDPFQTRFGTIKSILPFIRHCDEEYVVMSDCDNVCNINLSDVIQSHIDRHADITVVARKKTLSSKKPRTVLENGRRREDNKSYKHRQGERRTYRIRQYYRHEPQILVEYCGKRRRT